MYERANTETVRQVYEKFGEMRTAKPRTAAMQSLLGLYADDVEWQLPEMDDVPFAGSRQGVDSVREFFVTMADDMEVLQLEPQEFIAQGDKVVALGHYSWRVKATGKEFSSDFAHVCTVRDGKIVRFHEYMDTAAEIKAHRKRRTAASR